MKSEHQQKVEQLMLHADQELPKFPCEPTAKVKILRARLILEEALETIEALGVTHNIQDPQFDISGHDFNLVEVIDGCCDIKVVTTGTLSACGVDDMFYQHEVDMNNLLKFGPGGYKDEHGKWIKPPDHKPPNIKGLLAIEMLRKTRA